MLLPPLVLIMLQPDLGSALVVAAAALGVLIAAGMRPGWILGLLLLAGLGAVLAVKAGVLADYQLARFAAFTHPGRDPQGVAYNITQAHIAIAHGGLFGQGLFHGAQTRGAFVPEQQTDFVFSVAGEELGFLGSAAIIAGIRGAALARAADSGRRHRRRPAGRGRHRLLDRLPDLSERRDESRPDPGHRAATAVRLLRRLLDVRAWASRSGCCSPSTGRPVARRRTGGPDRRPGKLSNS